MVDWERRGSGRVGSAFSFAVNEGGLGKFLRAADNSDDKCRIFIGKDQLLLVRGTQEEVTRVLQKA